MGSAKGFRFRTWGCELVAKRSDGRERRAIDLLMEELAELRELDRRHHAHPRGSGDEGVSEKELERRNQRLMDRFRDLAGNSG